MKHLTIITALAALLLWAVPPVQAQYVDQDFGCGFSLGATHGLTEQNNGAFTAIGRAYLRHGLMRHLTGELNLATGTVRGRDFRAKINPIEARLLFSPFDLSSFNIYAYAGAGVMHHRYFDTRRDEQLHRDEGNWMGVIPVGLGMQLRLDEHVNFEVIGGYTHGLADNLNRLEGGPTDAYWHLSFGLTWIEAGDSDSDKDGLTSREERELGTDPGNPDTDGDGLMDGTEVRTHKTDPLVADSDRDLLSDGEEVNVHNTHPLRADTDDDGLGDGAEVQQHKTDPRKADTDDDGLKDGEEVTTTLTNPLKADTDNDGLKDGAEVRTYKTDPVKPDTDGDTLGDGDEVNKYGSNPLMLDSDGDTLNDDVEVNTHRTKPGVADTDGGSVDDGAEVKRGTDPLDRKDDVQLKAEVGKALVLEGIVFNTGSAEILPASEDILQQAYNTLRFNPDIIVQITGHTDSRGSKAKNMKLSDNRAKSVRDWLVAKGIDAARLSAKGFGPDRPAASNDTEEGRQKNRRIEFVRTR